MYLRHLLPLFFCLTLAACHQHTDLSETPFQHFQDGDNLIQLEIETDIAPLLADQEDHEYQPAKVCLRKNNGTEEHFHVEIKPRGVFRKAQCTFPPLKLRFPDEVLAKGGFKEFPTLKLVTHCEADSAYDQLVVKEYLAFRLYNELTDKSFRAQLVRVKYTDSAKQTPATERFGFLIEHPRELAKRMEGRLLGESHGVPKNIHLPSYKVFTLFQYMIGNTDWGLANRHNVEMITCKEGDLALPVPVPYDFDFCGFVDAPYAVPHHGHPIKDVKDRFFQWRGGETDFSDVAALFEGKRDKLLAIVSGCPHLDEQVRTEAVGYLQSFYELLAVQGTGAFKQAGAKE